jgi:nicotinamidase-related amidase
MKIDKNTTQALIVDIQEKLFPHMQSSEQLLNNCLKLIEGLKLLKVPFILNEQYPKGIGHTLEPIKELLSDEKAFEKFTFSCCQNDNTLNAIKAQNKEFVIVFGIEAHVCVLQTVLDLLENSLIPVVVVDCISSRKELDKDIAIKRMIQAGALPTTYESLLFELCGSAKNEVFKQMSQIIK